MLVNTTVHVNKVSSVQLGSKGLHLPFECTLNPNQSICFKAAWGVYFPANMQRNALFLSDSNRQIYFYRIVNPIQHVVMPRTMHLLHILLLSFQTDFKRFKCRA